MKKCMAIRAMLSMKQFQAAMYSSAIMAAASVIFSPSISHAN
jgi:hypothetical protein